MSVKSRAPEARKRRRVHKEIRRIVEQMRLDYSSSEDESWTAKPSPVRQDVLKGVSRDITNSSYPHELDSSQVDITVTEQRHQDTRNLRGRRLLYGSSHGELLTSNSNANDDSFSDNACVNEEQLTDFENDYAFNEHPVSTSLSSESDDNINSPDDCGLTIQEQIANFVTKYSVSMAATSELLQIFKQSGVKGLPNDRRALLKTQRGIPGIVNICGGSFKYFGLETCLLEFLQSNPTYVPPDNTLLLCLNVDGLPLYKSSSDQLWPLLCQISQECPFIIALYYGNKKPDSINDYLAEFIEEYLRLNQQGLGYNGNRYNVKLLCWICDAPARSFLKCIKGHTGYYACERCRAKGENKQRKTIYPSAVVYEKRTNEAFAAMEYNDPPDGDTHQTGVLCPLVPAQLNCVSDVVLDVMHAVYLGAWKRMLHFLMEGHRNTCRLSMSQKRRLNHKLVNIKLPREFARQPRTVFELSRWKATELRSSLLYTGYIFLKGVVSDDIYKLFIKFSVAMNILHINDNDRRNALLNFSRELILEYIRDSEQLIGNDFVVYNVHSLSHIPDDVEHLQRSVNQFNAFPFENHMQFLKKMVKGTRNPLAQICARLNERRRANCNKFYRSKHLISTVMQDSMFYLSNTHEFAMVQRRRRRDNKYDVLVFREDETEDLFTSPCPSKLIHVFLVRNLDNKPATPRILSKDALSHKVVLLRCENKVDFILIPMLHGAEGDRQ